MTRTKSLRYNAASDEPLLIQSGKDFFENCKGKWKDYFGNNNPIVLELACGRGEYTVGLSQIYPEKNFIGVDVKGERMMMGIKKWKAETQGNTTPNIAFLRTIIHHIDQFFAPGEIDEIWIIHPDPRPKGHDARRRITSPRFLKMYANILKPGGLLKLKTDDDGLFDYSIETIGEMRDTETSSVGHRDTETSSAGHGDIETSSAGHGDIETSSAGHQTDLAGHVFELIDTTWDLDHSPLLAEHHGIETHYGLLFKAEGRTIKYGIWKKL